MLWKRIALSAGLAGALAVVPFSQAEAHRHVFPLFWPFVAATAVVGTAAAVATAPFRAFASPYYYRAPPPYYYRPAPAYYAPGYYYGAPYYYGYR
ncbi:MAG TPA: hypothetical protein VHY35_24150 [Stellaceae bacterium]|jgi:hypothetical protein|nr:hypothetical protein [Stellaceae bacterium]